MEKIFETFEQFLLNEGRNEVQSFDNVTIGVVLGMSTGGINIIECKSLKISFGNSAQYNNAIFMDFIRKGNS